MRHKKVRALTVALLLLCIAVLGFDAAFADSQTHAHGRAAVPANSLIQGQITIVGTPNDNAQDPTSSRNRQRMATPPANHCNCVAGKHYPLPVLPPAPYFGPPPAPSGGIPHISGTVILVSVTQEWLWAYQNGVLAFATPVTTGMPQLPTPTGIFSVMDKVSDVMFYSPWPPGSPYYYSPEHVNYALLFKSGGFFIHDAPWRHCFGPGTNVPHTCPDGTQATGSHGCVNTPTSSGAWIYAWAPIGTTVDIVW